jgi:antitoxin component of RelBE/YafQ-DinJ toxin-antitoxin module
MGMSEVKRAKTTIVIDKDLWKEVKIRAIEMGLDASRLIEMVLRRYLEENKPVIGERK